MSNAPAAPALFRDRYAFRRRLAEGGMGVVYVAYDGLLEREVAVKLIRPDRLGTHADRARARFAREGQIMARLRHPACVPVYDAGISDGQPFLVMEYVEGRSLAEAIAEAGEQRLPVAQVVRWGRVLAEGLQACHDDGIVHRDVKPANVLLDRDGLPRLTDFGVARDDGARTKLTADAAAVGTLAYMAPEQAEGRPDVGPAADVYALGVTLYEALTGRLPFAAGHYVPLLAQVLHEPPPRPRALRAEVSPDLQQVLLGCLEKTPAERYPSARELAADLGRILRGEPIQRRGGRLGRWGRRLWRRRRLVVGAGLAGAALLGLALGGGAWRQRAARAQARQVLAAARLDADLDRAEADLRELSVTAPGSGLRAEAERALEQVAGRRLLAEARVAYRAFSARQARDLAEGAELAELAELPPTLPVEASPAKQRRLLLLRGQTTAAAELAEAYAQVDRLLAQAEALLPKVGQAAALRAQLHLARFRHLAGSQPEAAEVQAQRALRALAASGQPVPAELAPTRLALTSEPAAAWTLERYRYAPRLGVMAPELVARGRGALARELEPGDYRVVFRAAGHLEQPLTVAARRGRVVERVVPLVARADLGALAGELAALPGGRSPQLVPRHVFQPVAPCLLGRTEVTLEAWASYLTHTRTDARRWAGQLALDRRAPACLLTQPEALAYAAWLEGEALLYGLRARLTLPSLHQLAFAVRGELAWTFPWGSQYDPSYVGTTDGVPAQTPPVGSQPRDRSPLGVLDLAASVSELTRRAQGGAVVAFGGEQLGGATHTRTAMEQPSACSVKDVGVNFGFRIVVEPGTPPQATLPERDARRAQALAQQAVQLAQGGRPVDALEAATEALRHDPGEVALFKLRADLRSRVGDTYGCYLDMTQATLLAPSDPQAWEGLGTIQRLRGEWDAAEVAFTRALEWDAQRPLALIERAQLRERRQALGPARGDFVRWLALASPGDPSRGFVEGRVLALQQALAGE